MHMYARTCTRNFINVVFDFLNFCALNALITVGVRFILGVRLSMQPGCYDKI